MLTKCLLQAITAIYSCERESKAKDELSFDRANLANNHGKRVANFVSDLLAIEDHIQVKHDQLPPNIIKSKDVSKEDTIVWHDNAIPAFINNSAERRATFHSTRSAAIHDVDLAEPGNHKTAGEQAFPIDQIVWTEIGSLRVEDVEKH